MRDTPFGYRPFPPVRHVGIGIKFGVIDQSAKPGASPSAGAVGALDRLSQTINDQTGVTAKYAALEQNFWTLDGSFSVLPDDLAPVETGWWSSEVSGEDGSFASSPWVRYDFTGPVSTIGWSLYFDEKTGQYPTSVQITTYNADGSVQEDYTFDVSGTTQYIPHQVADYYAVRFTFLRTSEPFRRVRLAEVDFGLSEMMDANSIGKCTLQYGVDLTASTIPSRQISFTFDNSDKKYNLLDPDGIYEYLQEGQKIEASLLIDGTAVYMGSFYFTSASTDDNVLVPRVQGNDVIWELDEEVFRGGSNTTTTLSDAVSQVIARSDVKVRFGDGVADRPVVLALETDVKRREALRRLAQAAMCAVWVDRDEVVNFVDISMADDPVSTLTEHDLYDFSGISITEPVDMVEVVVKNPYLGSDSEAVYTAGEGRNIRTVENTCIAPAAGNAVAAWLLARYRRRKKYSVKNRCDPAVEIGDTIRIHDIYGNRGTAIVTDIEIQYDGGMYAVTGGVGN